MSVNQRIEELEKYYKTKGITFSKYININPGTLNNITGKRQSIPSHTILAAILKADPKININWLILGEGEMWSAVENANLSADLLKKVEELEGLKNQVTRNEDKLKKMASIIKELGLQFELFLDQVEEKDKK